MIPAINAFSYFPAFLIHLLFASSRGLSRTDMNPRNFFGELKRRNVYKVAVASAVIRRRMYGA